MSASLPVPEKAPSVKRPSKSKKAEVKDEDKKESHGHSRQSSLSVAPTDSTSTSALPATPLSKPNPSTSSSNNLTPPAPATKSKSRRGSERIDDSTMSTSSEKSASNRSARSSTDSDPLAKASKESPEPKQPPAIEKKTPKSRLAAVEASGRKRAGSNVRYDQLLKSSEGKDGIEKAWNRNESEERILKKSTSTSTSTKADSAKWTISSPKGDRAAVRTTTSPRAGSRPSIDLMSLQPKSAPNTPLSTSSPPQSSSSSSSLPRSDTLFSTSDPVARSPNPQLSKSDLPMRKDSRDMLTTKGSSPTQSAKFPTAPNKSPSNLADRLKGQAGHKRRRSQSVTPQRVTEKEDNFPYVEDVRALRRTKSEAQGFMHSWDFTPVFIKADRIKLKSKAEKRKAKKLTKRDSKRSLLKTAATRDLGFREATSPREDLDSLFDVSGLKYEDDELVGSPLMQIINHVLSDIVEDAFIIDFIYAHEQVISSEALFEQLLQRYTISAKIPKLDKLKLNIERVVSLWLTHRYVDFFDPDKSNVLLSSDSRPTPPILPPFRQFLEILNREAPQRARPLTTLIDKQEKKLSDLRGVNYDLAPEPLLSKELQQLTVEEYSLLLLHPLEVARQLTILDFEVFQQLDLSELLNCRWMKEESEAKKTSPNALQLIERFNAISFWMATEIVSAPNKKLRVAVLHFIIKLARHLKEIRNYHALMAVYCALNMFQIQRLSQTWADVPKADIKFLKSLDEFLSSRSNYINIRNEISEAMRHNESAAPKDLIAFLPFHGVFLKAFVGINENATFLEDAPDLVNLEKLRMVAVQSREISRLQMVPYNIFRVKKIVSYLQEVVMYNAGEELLSKLSKQCEQSQEAVSDSPKKTKEKEKEKEKDKEKIPPPKFDDKSKPGADLKKAKSIKTISPSVNILGRKGSNENPPAPLTTPKQ